MWQTVPRRTSSCIVTWLAKQSKNAQSTFSSHTSTHVCKLKLTDWTTRMLRCCSAAPCAIFACLACAGAMTLQQALRCHTDLLGPINKPAVQAFAAYASGDASAHLLRLLSPEGQADYKDWHKQSRCLLELMREFPAVRPPLGELLGLCATAAPQLPACLHVTGSEHPPQHKIQ